MSPIEATAAFFGLICVWFTVRENIWCWPTGLIQVSLYIVIFYEVKLYSDLILHVIYVGVQCYGWYHWLYGGRNANELAVSGLTQKELFTWLTVALVGTATWGLVMATYTDGSLPYGDAFTTVASLIAQWLMVQKKWETWLFWIAVDVMATGIYWQKGLLLTSGLYGVFLVLSVFGLIGWRRSLQQLAGEVA